ncbi:MAG: response regulator [Myxococcota bacterium]|nr:response regulator [Myxococcota bacterium]
MAETPGRVLVCDDENFFREAIRDILTGEALDVVEACDGEAALELGSDPSIGVAILDIRLPGIDGIEVLRRLREMRSDLRVIMLSAHTDQELVLEALRLGACDYLAKPLHDEELVLAVRRASESFRVSDDWGRLRGRVERLAGQLEEMSRRAADCEDGERRTVVAHAAVDVAADVLEAAKTSLMLTNDRRTHLRVVSARGRSIDVEEMNTVPIGDGVAGVTFDRGEPIVVADVDSDERFDAGDGSRYDSTSFAVAPIGRGGDALGVLCATDRAGGGSFDRDDLGLLRLLAGHVAAIFEVRNSPSEVGGEVEVSGGVDAQSGGESLDRSEAVPAAVEISAERDADLIRSVCEAITDEVSPERIFAAALRPLAEGLGAAPVSIFLIDARTGVLRCESSFDAGLRDEREELPATGGLTGSVFQTGRMIATDTPQADGRFAGEIDTPLDGAVGPMLCVPLSLRGKVVGVFRAFIQSGAVGCEGRESPLASARSGELVGSALSAAVRNALLYRSLLESIDEVAEVRRAARS